MKNVTIFLAFLFSFALSAATPTYELNSTTVNVGKLEQGVESSAVGTFLIKRTAKSPSKVELNFAFSEYYSYCSKHKTVQIWVPGEYKYVCHTQQHDGNTQTFCHSQYVPGHYMNHTTCVEYDYASTAEQESLSLDFKKASALKGSEYETFKVTVMQKNLTSDNFNVSIEPVKANSSYEITNKKFLVFKKSMSFKFKAI